MKRSLAALGAALILGILGLGLTAQAGLAKTMGGEGRALVPAPGYYEGGDANHRLVTFKFDGIQMLHFHANHRLFGGSHVSSHDSSWHRTCHAGYCSAGKWTTNTRVQGIWDSNFPQQSVAFHAQWRHGL